MNKSESNKWKLVEVYQFIFRNDCIKLGNVVYVFVDVKKE